MRKWRCGYKGASRHGTARPTSTCPHLRKLLMTVFTHYLNSFQWTSTLFTAATQPVAAKEKEATLPMPAATTHCWCLQGDDCGSNYALLENRYAQRPYFDYSPSINENIAAAAHTNDIRWSEIADGFGSTNFFRRSDMYVGCHAFTPMTSNHQMLVQFSGVESYLNLSVVRLYHTDPYCVFWS